MPSIILVLNGLINRTITQQIEQIEKFYKENKSSFLKDLLNDNTNDKSLNDNPIFIQLKKSLELDISSIQNPDNSEINAIKDTLTKKIKEIGQKDIANKAAILLILKNSQKELSGFVKQTQTIKTDEKRKTAYDEAKKALRDADQEILKENIKKNKNTKDIAELYKLINPNIISLARFFSLQEEIFKTEKELENNLTICLDFIRDKLGHPTENIPLSDLKNIPEWSKFKVSLQTKFEKNKRKNDAASTSTNEQNLPHTSEESDKLYKQNQQLINEISELKQKISFLETSITTPSNKNPESESLASAELDALKSQNAAEITELNNQFSQINENNQQLTAEIDTQKQLNEKQKQTIESLTDELGKLKTELAVKEKQAAENLTQLKRHEEQHKEQLLLKETDLKHYKSASEKSLKKISELSENLDYTTERLDAKKQALEQKESELTDLKKEKVGIELQIQQLNDSLQEKIYNDGLIKLKEEEILKLTEKLNQLKDEFNQEKDKWIYDSKDNKHNRSLLKSDIEEKELSIEKLKNELDALKKIIDQYKLQINGLKTDLELKEKELTQSELQLQTLTGQSKRLSDEKNILEQKYKIELDDALANYKALQAQLSATTEDLGEQLNKLHEKNIYSEKENQELKENLESFKTILKEEKASLLKAENQISELRNTLSFTQNNLASANQNFNAQLEATKAGKEKLVKEYDLFISEVDKILYPTEVNQIPSFIKLDYLSEGHNQILEKLHTLKKQIAKNDLLEDENNYLKNQISDLEFNSNAIESENIQRLTQEKQILEEQVFALETQLLEAQQNNNFDQPSSSNYDLEFDFDEDTEEASDDKGFRSTTDSTLNADLDPIILLAKQLESTKKSLQDTELELEKEQQKSNQFQTQLTEARKKLKESSDQIADLKSAQVELKEQDTTKQQRIAQQIEELNKFKVEQEALIQEFDKQKTDKETSLRNLASKLNTADQNAQELTQTIQSLKDEKVILENNLSKLKQKNIELQQKLTSANDVYRNQLQQEKTENEKSIQELKKNIESLEEKLETSQEKYSSSKEDYDNLKQAFEKQIQELNQIKTDLKTSKLQLKTAHEELKNIKANAVDARQFIQEELSNFKKQEGSMKDGDISSPVSQSIDQDDSGSLFDQKLNAVPITSSKHSDSSSGHGSRNSLSSDLNEDDDLSKFLNRDRRTPLQHSSSNGAFSESGDPLFQHRRPPQDVQNNPEMNLTDSEEEELSPTASPIVNSPHPFTAPIPEQDPKQDKDATLEKIELGVKKAFKQHSPKIIEAYTKEFSRIATKAAIKVFRDNFNNLFPSFEAQLEEIAFNEITNIIVPYISSEQFQLKISQIIHIKKLATSSYLEEILNSAGLLFSELTLKENNQSYESHIIDQGRTLLMNLCIENLQTNKKGYFLELAKQGLEKQATDNGLQASKHAETIEKISDELVTKLFKTSNLLSILKGLASKPIADLNLLAASQKILQDQLAQEIMHNLDHNFPSLDLDPVVEKVKNGIVLSKEEIEKFPSELQYTDTSEEFVAGLRVIYPNLPSNYENQLNEDNFKQLRLMLRKNSLSAINQTLPDDEILDLNTEMWLEKQLQLITGKQTKLDLIYLEKDQTNLLKELNSTLQLETFYDVALTPKSITELKTELKNADHAQLAATEQINQFFAEIEKKQQKYSEINDDPVAEFLEKMGTENNYEILHFTEEGSKELFNVIQAHLNNTGKWDYFNAKIFNYKINNIADELLLRIPHSDFDKDPLEKTIKYAIGFLCEKKKQDKLSRLQILKDISLLYASTKKLSVFNAEISNRKIRIKDLLNLKLEKDHEVRTTTGNSSANYEGIFLPHKCSIIADSHDPNVKKLKDSEFEMLANSFYSKDAMKTGQTLTFEQKLSTGNNRAWSVTKNSTSLAYNTSSWVDQLKNIGGRIRNKIDPFNSTQLSAEDKEVTFAAFSHAVASSKGPILTLSIGANCSREKELYIRLLIEDFNKKQKINGQKTTILIDANDKLKVHKDTKTTMQKEIYNKNSPSQEFNTAVTQSKETNRNIMRPRGA